MRVTGVIYQHILQRAAQPELQRGECFDGIQQDFVREIQVEEGGAAPAAGAVVALVRRPPVQCGADEVVVRRRDGGPRVHDHRVAAGEGRGAHGGGAAEPEEGPDAEPDHLEQQPRRHSAEGTPRGNKNEARGQGKACLEPEGKCRGKPERDNAPPRKASPFAPGREGSCRLQHVKHLKAGNLWCGRGMNGWLGKAERDLTDPEIGRAHV